MKTIYRLFAIALAALAFSACANKNVDPDSAKVSPITISEAKLDIPADGGNASFKVKADKNFTVSSDKAWCSVKVDGNNVTLSAESNTTLRSRYARVCVATVSDTVRLTAQQFGAMTSGFEAEDIVTNYEENLVIFKFSTKAGTMHAEADVEWITPVVEDDLLKIYIAENTDPSVPGSRFREGKVNWQLGIDDGTINVKQYCAHYMEENPYWKIAYEGEQTFDGETVDVVSNTVEAGAEGQTYGIMVLNKKDVDDSGLELVEFIEIYGVKSYVDAVNEAIEYYKQFGEELTFADFLFDESGEDFFSLENGDWYGIAIGFDEEGEPTGTYAWTKFTKKGSTPTGDYSNWLGTWSVPRGGKTDEWTITEKEHGSTYTVVGIEGTKYPAVANYVPATNSLVFLSQTDMGKISHSGGEITVGLYGTMGTSLITSMGYTICTGTLSKDGKTADFTPGSPSGEAFTGIRPLGYQEATGKYYLLTDGDETPMPNTITRTGGGQDDPPVEGFGDWLGKWNVDSELPFTISIEKGSEENSYDIHNWEDWENNVGQMGSISGLYENDEEMGSLIGVIVDSDIPVLTNVDIGAETPCNLYFLGTVLYEGDEVIIIGNYPAAIGAFDESKSSATLYGGYVEIEGLGEMDIVRLTLIAIDASEEHFYTFQDQASLFPLAMSKGGSSSSLKSLDLNNPGNWQICNTKTVRALSKPAYLEEASYNVMPYKADRHYIWTK